VSETSSYHFEILRIAHFRKDASSVSLLGVKNDASFQKIQLCYSDSAETDAQALWSPSHRALPQTHRV